MDLSPETPLDIVGVHVQRPSPHVSVSSLHVHIHTILTWPVVSCQYRLYCGVRTPSPTYTHPPSPGLAPYPEDKRKPSLFARPPPPGRCKSKGWDVSQRWNAGPVRLASRASSAENLQLRKSRRDSVLPTGAAITTMDGTGRFLAVKQVEMGLGGCCRNLVVRVGFILRTSK